MTLLTVENLQTYYGESHILQGINLEVNSGEIVVLVGRHGAGKTTALLSIMGIEPPRKGTVKFNDTEITGLPSWEVAKLGMGLVPENRRIFDGLTVKENLEIGQQSGRGDYNLETAFTDFPELANLRHQPADKLSGGQQQMLTIARTLMGNPKLLLMDEPTEGLAPILVRRTAEVIQRCYDRGKTLLITGQNIAFAMELAQRVYIIDSGKIKWNGTTKYLQENPDFLASQLAINN